MRRIIFCLFVILTMMVCIGMVKADNSIKKTSEYVLIKREKMLEIQAWITQEVAYMDQLLAENVALQAENDSLKKQLERSKKGLFIGGNVGLPLGGDVIIMYQFNKSGVYSQVGYQDGFNINIGYMRKIK